MVVTFFLRKTEGISARLTRKLHCKYLQVIIKPKDFLDQLIEILLSTISSSCRIGLLEARVTSSIHRGESPTS